MRKKDKTKFPVARIKKIMQMDEEVGKMAQATPILISKSLELFMQSIVDDVAKHAQVCNSKKVTSTHLKRCIDSIASYDFLQDIVESVVDDGDGGGADECIAKVTELIKDEETNGSAKTMDAEPEEKLGGGGGGAPLSMILDTTPSAPLSASDSNAMEDGSEPPSSEAEDEDEEDEKEEEEDDDDGDGDPSYSPATKPSAGRGRGRGRGKGRGRGRGGRRSKAKDSDDND